jgi:hypothetical protein
VRDYRRQIILDGPGSESVTRTGRSGWPGLRRPTLRAITAVVPDAGRNVLPANIIDLTMISKVDILLAAVGGPGERAGG